MAPLTKPVIEQATFPLPEPFDCKVEHRPSWRKMKGIATVRLTDGMICEAEIRWFEAHAIGRKDLKIKRVIR